MSERLPISVIVPCRNAMDRLPAHLDAINGWLGRVEQVIVVDSSDDGSFEALKSGIAHPGAEFHQMPPGLYAAWNFGVARASSEWIYFSTIGDHIDAAGIEKLMAGAREFSADVVISPPRLIQADGKPIDDVEWPIHRFLAARRHDGGVPFVPSLTERFFLIASFLPETIIGSSASNLYRKKALGDAPFPTDIGRFGDAAWMVETGIERRLVLIPEPCAEFRIHESEHSNEPVEAGIEATHRLLAMAGEAASRVAAELGNSFLPAWMALRISYEIKRVSTSQLQAKKRADLIVEKSRIIEGKNASLETTRKNARDRIAFLEDEIKIRNAKMDRQRERIATLYKRMRELEGPYQLNARFIDAVAGVKAKLKR